MAGGFQIVFEALDEASPTIQQLSQQLADAAAKSDTFASQVLDSTGKVDEAFVRLPPRVKETASSMSAAQEAVKELLGHLAGIASVAGVIEFFKSSADAAIDEESAMTRLAFAVNSTGGSFAAQKDKVREFAEEQASLTRFSETQTIDAMSRLVRITGDVGQSMTATRVAMGMASASGLDLNTTVGMLAPLLEGNTSRLMLLQKQFGAYVGDSKDSQTILNNLSKAFLNAAETQNDAGTSIAKLKNQLEEFRVQVGEGIVPIIQAFLFGLTKIAELTEIAAVEIAKFTVDAAVGFKTLGSVIVDAWHGAWSQITVDVQAARESIKAINEGAEKSELEIVKRYSAERSSVVQDEGKLKAKVSAESADTAKQAEEDKTKAARQAHDALIKLNDDLLAAQGHALQARLGQIGLQRDQELRMFQDLHDKGVLTADQLAQANQQVAEKSRLAVEAQMRAFDQDYQAMLQLGQSVASSLESSMGKAVADMILKGEDFQAAMEKVLNSVLQTAIETFTKIAIQQSIMESGLLAASGGAAAGGGGLFSFFQEGGVVTKPTAAIVGEKGPEAIIPLDRLRPAGGAEGSPPVNVNVTQNNTIQLTGASSDQVQELMRQMARVTRSGAAAGAELVKSISNAQARTTGQSV